MGPSLIFDKSVFQSLNPDEACFLDLFYISNITPLFYVEVLADLEKETRGGRTPEQVVSSLAYKTPTFGSAPNVEHSTLYYNNLLGQPISMDRRPVVGGAKVILNGDRKGYVIKPSPEQQAMQRWQQRRFLDVERQFAASWREKLRTLDLRRASEVIREVVRAKPRLRDLNEAKQFADELVDGNSYSYSSLIAALKFGGFSNQTYIEVIDRWKREGRKKLHSFAPYAAHVLTVDLFFYCSLEAGLISSQRASNRVDIAYLYYLPFCTIFTSSDRLHASTAPLFLADDQVFVWGADMKTDLAALDRYFSAKPAEMKAQGLFRLATRPPVDGEFLTSKLWDQFCPLWRERAREYEAPKTDYTETMKHLKPMLDAAKVGGKAGSLTEEEIDIMVMQRLVPTQMGKWRLLPPGIEDTDSE